jgi:hypothetical protein
MVSIFASQDGIRACAERRASTAESRLNGFHCGGTDEEGL